MNKSILSRACPLLLLVAWWAHQPNAAGMYQRPEIETVPTARLIANVEKRLASQPEESGQCRVGEEITIWTWSRLAPEGTYTVNTNGCLELPGGRTLRVAGRTREDLMQELNGTTDSSSKSFRGIFVEQAWHQRKGRLLPGERAALEYELARVYSIAYAQKPQDFQALKGGDRPFLGLGAGSDLPPDHRWFRSEGPAPGTPKIEMSPQACRTHLEAAVTHFRQALRFETNHLAAQIGLAWCLDQEGEKAAARRAYERALDLAWEKEKGQEYILETSYVQEIIGYLKPLLNQAEDSAELAKLKGYSEAIGMKGRAITPILFPLDPDRAFAELVNSQAGVAFDLDGSGLPRRWGWITPHAAWLVFDPQRHGQITSGLQLFGNVTFWVFWKNGYEALGSLDDDQDGVLSGAELAGLAAWRDVNGNGVCDPGEVKPLTELGVLSVSTIDQITAEGLLSNPQGLRLRDGSNRPTFDWIVRCQEK